MAKHGNVFQSFLDKVFVNAYAMHDNVEYFCHTRRHSGRRLRMSDIIFANDLQASAVGLTWDDIACDFKFDMKVQFARAQHAYLFTTSMPVPYSRRLCKSTHA